MAEGFTCDRCGAVHPGSPHGTITTADGIGRSRPSDGSEFELSEHGYIEQDIRDVCDGCLDAFEGWWNVD